jgi:hypothetical protein
MDENKKKQKGKLFTEEMDEKIIIGLSTYASYFKLAKNNALLALCLILFVVSEGLYSIFYYYFGYYDYLDDKDKIFYVSGIILLIYILMCIVKYTLIAYIVNNANQNLHQEMINCLLRTNI